MIAVLAVPALASGPQPQGKTNGPWTILTTPVTVEARLVEALPPSPSGMSSFSFTLVVRDAGSEHEVSTLLVAVTDLGAALWVLRSGVVWRSPYLFIRSECGGGNAWSCNTEVVFEVARGRTRELGAFIVGDTSREEPQSLRSGYFVDYYDKLEDASIGLSHARSPSFEIAIVVRAGRLEVDAEKTWSLGERRCWASEAVVSSWLEGSSPATEEVFSAVVEAAVIARYCGREAEVAELLRAARPRLGSEYCASLDEALRLTVPSELPSAWREARFRPAGNTTSRTEHTPVVAEP